MGRVLELQSDQCSWLRRSGVTFAFIKDAFNIILSQPVRSNKHNIVRTFIGKRNCASKGKLHFKNAVRLINLGHRQVLKLS